jgi:hypothetical protein
MTLFKIPNLCQKDIWTPVKTFQRINKKTKKKHTISPIHNSNQLSALGFGQENDAQDLLLFRFPDAYRADLASIAHRVEAEVSAQGTLQDDLSLLRFSQGRQSFGTMQKDWTFDDMCVLRVFSRNSRLLG